MFSISRVVVAGIVGALAIAGQFATQAAPAAEAAGSWQGRHGLTSAQYQAALDQLTGQGYKLALVNGYNVGGQALFAAIFQR